MLYNPNPHCSVVRFGRKLMAEILFHGYLITKICHLVRVIQTFCSNLTFPELTSCKKLDSCLWHAASARSRLLLMADLYSTDCVRCLRSTSNWWTCVAIHTYVMHNERKTWERNDISVVAMLFWWFVHHVSMERPLQTLLVSAFSRLVTCDTPQPFFMLLDVIRYIIKPFGLCWIWSPRLYFITSY